MFNPNLGIEAGYRDLGEVTAKGVVAGDDVEVSVEASGFFGGLVTRIPASERFNFAGRFGLLLWELDTSVRVNGIPAGSADDDGNDFYFGLGASYAVSNAIDLGLSWTRFDIDGDDVDAIELRTRFSF